MQTTGEARGTGVSPGVGRGELHVDIDDALDAIDERRPVVLALETSSPADVVAMTRAAAIVAVHGDALRPVSRSAPTALRPGRRSPSTARAA
jgi:phosphoenolpyruvate synthase/pyruvate phosphate dikinase